MKMHVTARDSCLATNAEAGQSDALRGRCRGIRSRSPRLGVAEPTMAPLEDGKAGGQYDQTQSTRDARIGRRDVPIRTSAWRRLRLRANERRADDRLQRQSAVVRSDRWTVRGLSDR